MAGATVLGVVGAAVATAVAWSGLRDYEGGDAVEQLPLVALPETPIAVIATVDESDELTSVTVFVARPGNADGASEVRGGSIISVPITLDLAGARPDRMPLYQAYAEGGAEQLRFAVGAILQISADSFEVMGSRQVAELLLGVGTVPVNLPVDVLDGSGPTVVFPAGQRDLTPVQMGRLLTSRSETEPDAVRRRNIVELWRAVATSVGQGIVDDNPAGESSAAAIVARVLGGTVGSRGLPALALDEALNPDGIDVEAVDLGEAALVFAAIAPGSRSAPADGRLIQIVAPPGNDAAVKSVVVQMLFLGHNVISVSQAGQVQPETDIIVYDPRFRADSEAANQFLGGANYPAPTSRVATIDIVIVLGTDFLSRTDVVPSSTTPAVTDPNN